jgi:hypothetical protein
MVFGGNGSRACVGKNIALVSHLSNPPLNSLFAPGQTDLVLGIQVEMHKFLSQLVRQFDFEIVDKKNPWRVETYWFAYQHDFNTRLKLRDLSPISK